MSEELKEYKGAQALGLLEMQKPFPPGMIGKLPKGTKAQNECPADQKRRCDICGGWHHPKIVHLDYVGHAALTQRLLQADINWSWEPFAVDGNGLPRFDESGGLWIRLTVCGVTRIGYGDAAGKFGNNAIKEAIGDALRNAAMRFGAALDLWHKGDWEAPTIEGPPEPAIDPADDINGDGRDSDTSDTGRPSLPEYLDADVNKNMVAWQKVVDAKRKTPEELVSMLRTKAIVSDAQAKKIIDGLTKKAEGE